MKKKVIFASIVLIIIIILVCVLICLSRKPNIKIYNPKEGQAFSESGLFIDVNGIYPRELLTKENLIVSGIPDNIAENIVSKIRSNDVIILKFSEQDNQTINELYFDYVICDENQNILGSTNQIHYKDYMPIKKAVIKMLFNTYNVKDWDKHINYSQSSNDLYYDSNSVYTLINIDSKISDINRLKILVINPKYKNNSGESISLDNAIIKLEGSVNK